MIRKILFSIIWLLTFTAISNTAEIYELPSDATEAETAAYEVLDRNCSRCHQNGKLQNGLSNPKDGFGHILELRRLAEDSKLVDQRNPEKSRLLDVIGPNSYPSMPADCKVEDESCYPSKDDIGKLVDWIKGQATLSKARNFVSLSTEYRYALEDLLKQRTDQQINFRYISLRVMHNDPKVTTTSLTGYRAGTVKLLNALSRNPNPYKFEAIDANNVLLRIYLPDLDWDADTWKLLEDKYTYGLSSEVDPSLPILQKLTNTIDPIIRADWLGLFASQPPLYHDILRLPKTLVALAKQEGIDINHNILKEQMIRSGFQNSRVSDNNRLIERHGTASGFFWTSYDFSSSADDKNLFENPLGPIGVFPDNLVFPDNKVFPDGIAFNHDGGETIFTLPNGFHAYFLNEANGERIDKGPINIVRDTDYLQGTGEVVNGISCISCHVEGMNFNVDKVREIAGSNFAFPANVRQKISGLYPGDDVVQKILKTDQNNYYNALRSAGINPETRAGGLEPVRGLFVYHNDIAINFEKAANELGMTSDEFKTKTAFVGQELGSLIGRLDQSPLKRDEWDLVFPELLKRVTDFVPVNQKKLVAYAPLSYSVQKVISKTVAKPANAVTPKDNSLTLYTALIGDSNSSTRTTFKAGDKIKIIVEPRAECRLTLVNISSDGKQCLIFPHPKLPDVAIPAGGQFVFPPTGAITVPDIGKESILAFCNASTKAINLVHRNGSQLSCDPSVNSKQTQTKIKKKQYESFVVDLTTSASDQKTGSGVNYKALSTRNPELFQSRLTIEITK